MLMTTTQILQGKEIVEYKGMVFGEVVSGVNIFKDMFSGIRDVIGASSAFWARLPFNLQYFLVHS